MSRGFWLVQRMEQDWGPQDGPIELVCEYMGSSEFEFGTVPAARKRLDTCDELITIERGVTLAGVTRPVFFLGALSTIDQRIVEMQAWVDAGLRGQESSLFDYHFTGKDMFGNPLDDFYRTVAWWALDEDLVWALEERYITAFTEQRDLIATPFGSL